MKILIEVRQDHIDRANRLRDAAQGKPDNKYCPITLAVQEAMGSEKWVWSYNVGYERPRGPGRLFSMSDQITGDFATYWDAGIHVEPIAFVASDLELT